MTKQRCNRVALADFEIKAQEFNSLCFAYCEEQLRLSRTSHQGLVKPEDTALAAATLSVQESIKTLLAIARIERA